MTETRPGIRPDRLRREIEALAEIGLSEDGGIYRMAFTDADMQAREWLMDRIREANLEVATDGAANVFGRLHGRSQGPVVMMGSHLDTVPAGGHLDGALGVLVALECLRAIKESGIQPENPIEMVVFSDEEGRFGPPLGSRALVGDLTRADLLGAADLNGTGLSEAMKRVGLEARDALKSRRLPEDVKAYLELHIEQGPILEENACQIGIVEAFAGLFKWKVRLIGDADHAGTTPMHARQDAFMGLAEFAAAIPRVLDENGSDVSVATVGNVELLPGSANSVPGQAEFSLDVRDPDEAILDELHTAFRRVLSAVARRRSLMFEFDVLSTIDPVECDGDIVDTIARTADRLGYSKHRMLSGAIHDAQIMSHITRVGMIFVPSKDGRSHSAAEWTHWEDIEAGAHLSLETLMHLAGVQEAEAEQTV